VCHAAVGQSGKDVVLIPITICPAQSILCQHNHQRNATTGDEEKPMAMQCMLTFRMTAGHKGAQAHIASLCMKGSGDSLAGATVFADGLHERTKDCLTYSAYIYDASTKQLYTIAVMDWPKRFPEDHVIIEDFWRLFIFHVQQHDHIMQERVQGESFNIRPINRNNDRPKINLQNFSMDEAS
jgi:hypothetical protein